MKILLTGFDPFDREKVNPAFEAVKLLPDTIAGGTGRQARSPHPVWSARARCWRPQADISPMWLSASAGGRARGHHAGEGRYQPNGWPHPGQHRVSACGCAHPGRWASRLLCHAAGQSHGAADAGRGASPAAVSYTAGTYVCNSLMYTLLFLIDRKFPGVRGGFIHVPYAMEQAVNKPLGTPSMDLRQISRGLEKAVEAVVICGRDTAVPMGTTH